MKYLIMLSFFLMLFLSACSPQKHIKSFVGIDVSLSAKSEINANISWLKERAYGGQNIVIFIFADQCYESYAGPRPGKDRDIDDLIIKACTSAKNAKWDRGTKFENIVTFLSNRVSGNKNEESHVFIYSDGYFEESNFIKNNTKSSLNQLYKNGLTQVTFKGVRIDAKEKIYTWFKESQIKVNFVE